MAHAQKPDFVFRRNGRVHLNRRGASVQSTTGSRGVRISGSNAGYTMLRGSVKSTGYPFHSSVSSSLPHPVRHRVSSHFNWSLICKAFFLHKFWDSLVLVGIEAKENVHPHSRLLSADLPCRPLMTSGSHAQ